MPWGLVEARTAGLGPALVLGLAALAVVAGLSEVWTDFRRSAGMSGLVMLELLFPVYPQAGEWMADLEVSLL